VNADPDDVTRRVAIAFDALKEANDRREVAVNAVIDYALTAYVKGEPIDEIMEACGFPENGRQYENDEIPEGLAQLIPALRGKSRVQAFAQWLGQSLAERICERAGE
jgi:hypothetical protein